VGSGGGEAQINPRWEGLLSVFERMRERPRRQAGDRMRPLLLMIGPRAENRQLAHLFVERCKEGKDPHAHVTISATSADVSLLLRYASREISKRHPRREPPIRFPLLSMALWLEELRQIRLRGAQDDQSAGRPSRDDQENRELVAELVGVDEDHRRRDVLGKGVRRRGRVVLPADRAGEKGKVATLFTYLEQIAPLGVAAVALLSATAASTLDLAAAMLAAGFGLSLLAGQILARTRDWAGRRRYRWFTRQPYFGGTRSFLRFAMGVFDLPALADVDDPEERDRVREQLDLLLVAAFLEDLRQAYRRGILRAHWARVRYPALVIDRVSAEHVSLRLLELVEKVRATTDVFDPLVIAAGIDAAEHPALADELSAAIRVETSAGQVDLSGVAAAWTAHLGAQDRVAVLGTRREMRVRTDSGDGSDTVPIHRPRRRPRSAHPMLPWLVMGAILAASLSMIVLETVRYCDPHTVWHARNGECVGVSDGSYVFSERLAGVERRIEKLNDDVLRTGKPYVTVVYLGPMTVDPATRNPQADLLAGIHGELVGLSIAQEAHNAAGAQPRLRLLLANTGSKFRYAREVAERIRAKLAEDRTIVAAVGFGQSKKQTQDAINVLSQAALPMIGTTNTFDDTAKRGGNYSPYYYRLAPPNRRLAAHAAYWAKNGLLGERARTAAVFYDGSADDLYSTNLAKDFAAEFGQDDVQMLPYTDPTQIPGKVLEACAKPAQVFYYAGRSDEFRSFVTRLSTTSCGGRRIVLAGDEVTKYVSDNAVQLGQTDTMRLYFTPLAAREAWQREWVAQEPVPIFYRDFEPVVGELVGKDVAPNARPSRTHAAIAYDAALVVSSVAEQIYGEQGLALPTAGAVLAALTEPNDSAPSPQGASGLLSFGPRSAGHEVVDKPVLLVTVRPDGTQQVRAVCGRLVKGARHTADCPPSR
jgi:ABC-type branched-subunit amino acid transport system substrate-binding protein